MTTDASNPTGPAEGATPEAPANGATSEAPEWFKAFESKQNAKNADIFKNLGQLKEHILPKAKEEPKAPAKVDGLTRDDVTAAMRLGEVKGKLPETARAKLDAMLERGAGFAQALEVAEMLAEVSGAGAIPASSGAKPPIGHAATAAHSPASLGFPATKREYRELVAKRESDPAAKKRLDALRDDPNFDLANLK